mgnify:FL=1
MKQESFQEDAIEYILSNYEINNNRNISNMVFRTAYEYGHSSGYREILNEIIDFAEFAESIVNEIKGWNKLKW